MGLGYENMTTETIETIREHDRLDDTIKTRQVDKSGEEPTDDEIEWTTAKFEDELFQYLANYTEGLDNDGDIVKVKPYYQQAADLMPRIPVWIQDRFGAAPPFEIKKSTLTPEIKKRIIEFKKNSYESIFNEAVINAVGKLFENIDPRRYHRSVKGLLTVVFV